jgi:predicted transcriptional regulator
MVAEFILGESFVIMSSSSTGSSDPSDFLRFVMQHNWEDPLAMSELAEFVDPSAHRVHEHDRRLRG